LSSIEQVAVETDKPLGPCTSYRIGGPTAVWAAPRSEEGVRRVLEAVHAAGVPLFILGRGSNLLVSDRGWQGVTLYMGENFSGWAFHDEEAAVRAGTLWMDLIRDAVGRGMGGMELMAGIPGGIGGALRMNAGAFGREIEALTVEVAGCLPDGSRLTARRHDVDFGYRCAPQLDRVVITRPPVQPHPPGPAARGSSPARAEAAAGLPLRQRVQTPARLLRGAHQRPASNNIGGAEVSHPHASFI
jgi:UDP-N-acetylmuramate dehydrogenase